MFVRVMVLNLIKENWEHLEKYPIFHFITLIIYPLSKAG